MKKILSFIIIVLINFVILVDINVARAEELSNDMVINNSYSTTSYYNDPTLYQNDKYLSYYFKNLTNNFGNNIKGSCTYVAFAMLLSYYDTYWDDSIIPENYDMVTMLSSNELGLNVESPGIYTENESIMPIGISTEDYYQAVERYSNSHLHLKLIQMGKEKFGQYEFDDPYTPCGLTYYELLDLADCYLYDYMGFNTSKISHTSTRNNVRQFVINNIQNGKPVLVRMKSTTITGIGHAFILYDYDEVNDELYGHLGWKSSTYGYEHIKLSTTLYDYFLDAMVFNITTPHSCSNNYKYSEGYNHLETYCPCKHGIHDGHNHNYANYEWVNNTMHNAECHCGTKTIQGHVVSSDAFNNGQRYATCLLCGGNASIGIIQNGIVVKVSENGSFILNNGLTVLVREDIDAYKNGVLVFRNIDEENI